MRFLHTADWHLGRLFHQVHLTEDQDAVLRQLIAIARDARVDAVVVAGDVYDRAVPPPEAVRLLDDVLAELLIGAKIPVIVTAGNHDSPERLAFASRLLSAQGLHLFGLPSKDLAPVVLADAYGPVAFYVAPYAEPALVRERLDAPGAIDHDSAMDAMLSSLLTAHPPNGRAVFVGHAFVQGGTGSDSERPLSVGGAGTVNGARLAPFCYAALGHLHRPQTVGRESTRYAGSLLKYSVDEIGQDRSVTIVDVDAAGRVTTEGVLLRPRRELRRIEGTLDELLRGEGAGTGGSRDDYIVARLTDPHPVLDPAARLRRIYPNLLTIERLESTIAGEIAASGDKRGLDHDTLFELFFKDMMGEEATAAHLDIFRDVAARVSGRDREVPS
jgi:exonuclease SbcD